MSPQLIEQHLSLLQIQRIEALGEPAVDRGEKIVGLLSFAPIGYPAFFDACRARRPCYRKRRRLALYDRCFVESSENFMEVILKHAAGFWMRDYVQIIIANCGHDLARHHSWI
jgi:hypothetical protein